MYKIPVSSKCGTLFRYPWPFAANSCQYRACTSIVRTHIYLLLVRCSNFCRGCSRAVLCAVVAETVKFKNHIEIRDGHKCWWELRTTLPTLFWPFFNRFRSLLLSFCLLASGSPSFSPSLSPSFSPSFSPSLFSLSFCVFVLFASTTSFGFTGPVSSDATRNLWTIETNIYLSISIVNEKNNHRFKSHTLVLRNTRPALVFPCFYHLWDYSDRWIPLLWFPMCMLSISTATVKVMSTELSKFVRITTVWVLHGKLLRIHIRTYDLCPHFSSNRISNTFLALI